MHLRYRVYTLHLRHTFRHARSASDMRQTVVVELEHEGIIGRGECAPLAFYGESVASVCAALRELAPGVEIEPRHFQSQILKWREQFSHQRAVLCALDIALHDWIAQFLGVPLYQLWGLNPADTCQTSITIAIAPVEEMLERVREAEARGFRILKIKVGFPDDVKVIRAIRERTDATIRVDANGGWSLEEALEKIPQLAELHVEFVEQPLPAEDENGLRTLHRESPIPIFLDESVRTAEDVLRVVEYADGVVVKLVKCGGLLEAQRLLHVARTFGLKVMLGCMIESSLGITAAAHLSPLADYADLDSPWLIQNDPFEGVLVEGGALQLSLIHI